MPDLIYTTTGTELTSIADAIRTRTGESGQLEYPADFISGIENINGNVVTGTFTTPASSQSTTISIPYTGDGFPIFAAVILPRGVSAGTTKGTYLTMFAKNSANTAPDYSSSNLDAVCGSKLTCDGSAVGFSPQINISAYNSSTFDGTKLNIAFKSKNELFVHSAATGSNSGLIPSTVYNYVILYKET